MESKLDFSYEAIQDSSTGEKTYHYVVYSDNENDGSIKFHLHAKLSNLRGPKTKGEVVSIISKVFEKAKRHVSDCHFEDFAHHLLDMELIGDFKCIVNYESIQ